MGKGTRVSASSTEQNGFAYPSVSGFDSRDWLISQRLPSGSEKCAVRSPQGWSVGGLRNVTPSALSASYAASTFSTPAARSTRGAPSILSSLGSEPSRSAAPETESRIRYRSCRRKVEELASLPVYGSLSVSR